MTAAREETHALLERARALDDARDYPELAEMLKAVPSPALEQEPTLGFLLADVLRRVGEGPEAVDVLDRLSTVLDRRGNDRLHRRRLNLLGTLHFEQGRLDAAREAWLRQVSDASTADDQEFVARANNNLGVLSSLSTDWEQAVAHYGRAVAAYQRLGYRRGLGQSHQNLAITYREMGFPDEAATHFQQAIHFAGAASEDEVARAEQERAVLLLVIGDPAMASVTAQRARSRYRRLGDPAGEGETERVRGLVDLSLARFTESRAHLDRALELGVAAHAMLLEAETVEALAGLEEALENPGEADELRARADRLFATMGAPAWGAQTRLRVAEMLVRAQDTPPMGFEG
jgi:tetratricopeptide (TPR) repeat protein